MRNAVDIPSKAAGASARSSGTIAGTSGAEFSDEGIVPREQGWSDWVEESAMAVIDQASMRFSLRVLKLPAENDLPCSLSRCPCLV